MVLKRAIYCNLAMDGQVLLNNNNYNNDYNNINKIILIPVISILYEVDKTPSFWTQTKQKLQQRKMIMPGMLEIVFKAPSHYSQ